MIVMLGVFYALLIRPQRRNMAAHQALTGADYDPSIADVWTKRADRYSEIRTERTSDIPRIEMSYIGG